MLNAVLNKQINNFESESALASAWFCFWQVTHRSELSQTEADSDGKPANSNLHPCEH